MSYYLKKDNMLNIIANKTGGQPKTAEKYLEAIYELILEELEINGKIRFQGFGEIFLKDIKGYDKKINDIQTGEQRVIYVTPKYRIYFTPSKTFKDDVNERGFQKKPKEVKYKRKVKEELTTITKKAKKPKASMEQEFFKLIAQKESKLKDKENENG